MIKKVLITIFFAVLVYLAFMFVKTSPEGEKALCYLKKKAVEITEGPREKITDFLEERRKKVEEEIEKEKEQIKEKVKEEVKETGKGLWERLGDFFFRRKSNDS